MNKGFTLIEVIATLVIVGILVNVIIPRYLTIIDSARNSVLTRTLSEGQARVNVASGRYLLLTGSIPSSLSDLSAQSISLDTDVGSDYSLSFADGNDGTYDGVDITASDTHGNSRSAFQAWPQPL